VAAISQILSFLGLPYTSPLLDEMHGKAREQEEDKSSCYGNVSPGLQPTPEEPWNIKCRLSAFGLLFYIKPLFHSTKTLQNETRANDDKFIDCKLSV